MASSSVSTQPEYMTDVVRAISALEDSCVPRRPDLSQSTSRIRDVSSCFVAAHRPVHRGAIAVYLSLRLRTPVGISQVSRPSLIIAR
jgi:hypothetical protein